MAASPTYPSSVTIQVLTCFHDRWGEFIVEKYRLQQHRSRLDKRLNGVLLRLQTQNSQCLTSFCQDRRKVSLTNITTMMEVNVGLSEEPGG